GIQHGGGSPDPGEHAMKIILAGAGAFGAKHLDAIRIIGDVEVVSLVGRTLEPTRVMADKYGIEHVPTELSEAPPRPGVEAAILATPTQLHAAQAAECLKAGKHVQVEIPLADNWSDAQAVAQLQAQTGLICMVGHTRRFNPSHQWIHKRIAQGELALQQLDVQSYFFRRTHLNALGPPGAAAAGRADLFLPAHEHQRPRPAALLDRPSAVASRRAHRRPVRLPV